MPPSESPSEAGRSGLTVREEMRGLAEARTQCLSLALKLGPRDKQPTVHVSAMCSRCEAECEPRHP